MRALFANNDIYKPLLLYSRAQGVSGKNEQPAQTPWRGVPRSAGSNAAASVASALTIPKLSVIMDRHLNKSLYFRNRHQKIYR